MLSAYSWPGNIRELRNALERAVVFSRPGRGVATPKSDLLEPENFPESVQAAAPGAASPVAGLRSLEEVEREVIAATLEATHYQISRSAIEITEVRDGDAALKKLEADRSATVVLLDAAGKHLDSNALAKWLGELRDRGTRELIFL